MTHKTTIYNNIAIDNNVLAELKTMSNLEEDDIVQRLKSIYIQTNKEMSDIIDNFIKHEYNILETIKSFYIPIIQNTETRTKTSKSINQLRMREIRKYMDEREKIKSNT